MYRDMEAADEAADDAAPGDDRAGRSYIAVIGINRYLAWNRLYNAASDARGAMDVFLRLGFELVGTPLFDEQATGEAMRRLVTDDLASLGASDSLVVFFAGHGHTVTRTYHGGTTVKDGYLIPVDGEPSGGRTGTWLRLEGWLTEITRIPAKHILVVLDACHSGLALGPIIQWRGRGPEPARREPLDQLRARRSRRIITSALDDQLAMDGGPMPGHSLFTGCLIEGLTGGLMTTLGESMVTGSEIAHYVQRRVSEYPDSQQTPDFGALELDDRGELVVHIAAACPAADTPVDLPDPRATRSRASRAPAAMAITARLGTRMWRAPAPPLVPIARPLAHEPERRELVARAALALPVVQAPAAPTHPPSLRVRAVGTDPGPAPGPPRVSRWRDHVLRWAAPAIVAGGTALVLRLLWELSSTVNTCR